MLVWQQCEFAIYLLCINVFTLATLVLQYFDNLTYSTYILHPEYDYIIVGSGTAGSLISHRISMESDVSHVMLEAGPVGSFLTDIPVLSPMFQTTVYDWQYETVPQQYACRSLKEQKSKWPRGRVVGGSAKLNNMIHTRGNMSHYVDWFAGKYSLNYIEKQFNFIEKNVLQVNNIKHTSKLANAFIEAAVELGYNVGDLNKEFNLGFMKSAVNQRSGQRWTTSHKLQVSKNNLSPDTKVLRVLIDSENKAYGVEYLKNGRKGIVKAKKGVILSAGTIDTPKILLLSGIGPKDHLMDLGIPMHKELPVGKNLQDHVTTGMDLIVFNQSLNFNALDLINPFNLFNYVTSGTGPFTSPGCEVVGLLSTSDEKTADLQFMVLPVGVISDHGIHLRHKLGLSEECWKDYFSMIIGKQTASVLPIVLHPKSVGEVKLKSNNPDDLPLINPNYFKEKDDIDVIVKGLQIIRKFVDTEAMKKLGAYINPQPFPSCGHHKLFSVEYWECYARGLTLTSYHPIGTCKMGPRDSPDSVVDDEFKLIGINNLFVADGSVLPSMPSGNPNAAIALMASIFFERHFKTNTTWSE